MTRTKIKKKAGTKLNKATAVEVEDPNIALGAFSLSVGDEVRFRRNPGQTWMMARVKGINASDGSLFLIDSMGHMRAIMAALCERTERGPRGGRHWVALDSTVKK